MAFLIVSAFCFILLQSANATAWRLEKNIWSEGDEQVYGDFVTAIGKSRHSNLNRFIKDSKVNPLYGEEDKKFNLSPDCADLPYVIRAYVAYKLRLPFSYIASISGKGGDQRYSRGNKPTSFKDQDYFSSPQRLFSKVLLVNSGYFRTAANLEDSDFYPVKINRKTIIPGTVYYDPDGHIAIVSEVTPDGRIRLISAHPDRTISKPWFGAKFSRGTKNNGGGFKQFRPIRYTSDGRTIRSKNHNIPYYSVDDQFQKSFTIGERQGISYYDYVRFTLSENGMSQNPMNEFIFMMKDLHEDISYRALSVNLCIEKKIHQKPHPGALPWNIYGTDGIWEEFSTPSRDARLKVAFRDFYDRTRQLVIQAVNSSGGYDAARELATAFLQKYHILSPQLGVSYINTAGHRVTLTFDDICNRLFDLSFDPYHSIEYRWGAKGEELITSQDNETKKRFYNLEYRLRNQLERVYNKPTPLSIGTEKPPDVDIQNWLTNYLHGKPVDASFIAFNRETIEELASDSISVTKIQIEKKSDIPSIKTIAITKIDKTQLRKLPLSEIITKKNLVTTKFSEILADGTENLDYAEKKIVLNIDKKVSEWDTLFSFGDRFAQQLMSGSESFMPTQY